MVEMKNKIGLHTFMAVPAFALYAVFFIYPFSEGNRDEPDGLGRDWNGKICWVEEFLWIFFRIQELCQI